MPLFGNDSPSDEYTDTHSHLSTKIDQRLWTDRHDSTVSEMKHGDNIDTVSQSKTNKPFPSTQKNLRSTFVITNHDSDLFFRFVLHKHFGNAAYDDGNRRFGNESVEDLFVGGLRSKGSHEMSIDRNLEKHACSKGINLASRKHLRDQSCCQERSYWKCAMGKFCKEVFLVSWKSLEKTDLF